jgi:CHASE2 domain-containing sensor protein
VASRSPESGRIDPRSPFRGLRSFSASAEDAALFFGRDREREMITSNLLASRLTLLYGQSGVGKSSILCAGVVYPLRQTAPSRLAALSGAAESGIVTAPTRIIASPRVAASRRRAVCYVSEWHGDPRGAILKAVIDEAKRLTDGDWPSIEDEAPLDEVLKDCSEQLDAQILLILDQFEQYFLYHPPTQAAEFDRELANAIMWPDLRMRCLISLRQDALVELDRFKGAIPNLFDNRLRLQGLTEQAALEAIRGPIECYNEQRGRGVPAVELEPGLAEGVVGELSEELSPLARGRGVPSALGDSSVAGGRIEPAHLQLVMEALWEHELEGGSTVLRVESLATLGGCGEIVRSRVEVGLDALPARLRPVAARAIRFLVTPSGTKVAHTVADLADYAKAPAARVGDTLERLCKLRILRPLAPPEGSQEPRYEVFHDLLAEPILEWRARFEAQRLRARVRWLLAAVITAVAAAFAIGTYSIDPAALRDLELSTLDARFAIRGTVTAGREIVIVALDDRTLRALGGRIAPSLRPDHAELIDLLVAGQPKAIAYDVEFTSAGDESQLLAAIRRAKGRLVLVSEHFDDEGQVPLFGRQQLGGATELLEELNAHAGLGAFPLDPGNVYRRMWRHAPNSKLPTLSAQVDEIVAPHSVPAFANTALIDYHGSPRTFTTVSMLDVLRGAIRPSFFKGKIVVVGMTARAGKDLHRTSVTSAPTMPGVEIQANAIATLRHGLGLKEASTAVAVLLIVLLSLFALLAAPLPWWGALALFAGTAGAYLIAIQILFDDGLYLPLVYPLLALAIAGTGTLAIRVYTSVR